MAQKPNKWLGMALGIVTGLVIVIVMTLTGHHQR